METGVVAKSIANKPKLDQDNEPFAEVFFSLHACRHYTEHGPNPIPLVEIGAALDLFGIVDREDRLSYLRMIQLVDLEYVSFMTERMNRVKKDGGRSGLKNRRRQQGR